MPSSAFGNIPPFSDFPVASQPGMALLNLRGLLEERLRWLATHLVPDRADPSGPPGEALREAGYISKNIYEAISEIFNATDPTEHGRHVTPESATGVVKAGLAVLEVLDPVIGAVEEKISALDLPAQLIYRLLELPIVAQVRIAQIFGVDETGAGRDSRIIRARKLLEKAGEAGRIAVLDRAVAQATLRPTSG